MRPPPDTFTIGDRLSVSILQNPLALTRLRYDIAAATIVRVAAYLIEPEFFKTTFIDAPNTPPIFILADARMKDRIHEIYKMTDKVTARLWANNRTMHTKAVLLAGCNVAHIGSHNLTFTAYQASINTTVRLENPHLYEIILDEWARLYTAAKPLPRTA